MRVYFRETSHMQIFVKIKHSRNGNITQSFTDIRISCHSHEFLTSQMCLLMLFAKIKFSQKIRIYRRLRWFGHVERSSGAIRIACEIQIDGRRGAGRPRLTWKKLTGRVCREWKLTKVDPQKGST